MTSKLRFLFSWLFMIAGSFGLLSESVSSGFQGETPSVTPTVARDVKSVHVVVDTEIRQLLAKAKIPASPEATDAEFLRRVSLDLNGRLPTPQRVLAFIESNDKNKRVLLIEELLASPEFGNHIARVWTKRILAIGTPGPQDTGREFQAWLAQQINQGKGWDEIVRSMLTATGRANPVNFFVDVNTDDGKLSPALLTGATTQLFLGVQVQCAECHNHPFTELKQTDFWGLATFYSRTSRVDGGKKGGPSEVQDGVVKAAAKANKKKGADTGTATSNNAGLPAIVIPASGGNKGSGKVVPAKFLFGDLPESLRISGPQSLRPFLAQWVASPANPFFAKNAANWAWSHLFGRGFINPIDDLDNDSVPSHPASLKKLAEEFTAAGFDLRHLFRCICTSETYGRSSMPMPDNKDDTELFSHTACRTISPEVFHGMMTDVLAMTDLKPRPKFNSLLTKNGGKGKVVEAVPKSPAKDQFIKTFTTEKSPDKQVEFSHGIPQMLRLINAEELKETSPRIALAMAAGNTPEKAIEHLYLAVLSRRPLPEELRIMLDYASRRPSPREGVAGVLWILVNSSEFQLNH